MSLDWQRSEVINDVCESLGESRSRANYRQSTLQVEINEIKADDVAAMLIASYLLNFVAGNSWRSEERRES